MNTRYAPLEIKQKVIKADQLINYIKKDISTIDKKLLGSKKNTYEVANWLLSLDTPQKNDYSKYEVEVMPQDSNVNTLKEEIRNRLIEFRTRKAKEKNIPAYYIFTNEELEKIVEKLPKTVEELKNLHILPEVKLKLHGEEIIEMITK